MKVITPKQYAKFKGCSLQNITALLRNERKLECIKKVKKFSRFYVLEVSEYWYRKIINNE